LSCKAEATVQEPAASTSYISSDKQLNRRDWASLAGL